MNAIENLLNQIDTFIRKYYKNEMIKGVLLFSAVFIVLLLFVTGLEYVGRFNQWVRGVLFFSFLLVNGYVFVRYLLLPVLRILNLGRRIDRLQASKIIGAFFPGVSDRLLNTLQLQGELDHSNYELLRATVMQRSKSLSVFNFTDAVNVGETKRLTKWFLPLFFFFLGVSIFLPGWISQGTERVVRFDKDFIPPPPFRFSFINLPDKVNEGDTVVIALKLEGQLLPENVNIMVNGGAYRMVKEQRNLWSFNIPKVSEKLEIVAEAQGYKSDKKWLEVLPKATLGKLSAQLNFPDYLGKENQTIENATQLLVPEGTRIVYSCLVKNTKEVVWKHSSGNKVFTEEGFGFQKQLKSSELWSLIYTGRFTGRKDSLSIVVEVIKDQFPGIAVAEVVDSVKASVRYFTGQITDDYGLRSLVFKYKIESKGKGTRVESMKVMAPNGLTQKFDFAVDFSRENIALEDKIEYWFEVADNDGVNGSKLSKSQVFTYKIPSLSELNKDREEERQESQNKMSDLLKRSLDFNKDIKRLERNINNSKSNSWGDKNELNRLMNEQKSLQKDLMQLQQQMEQSLELKNKLSEMDPVLLEKQNEIQNLLEKLMDPEMLELLKKLEDLMDKGLKDQMMREMEQLDQSAENQQKALDRTLEMLKKLEVNEKLDDIEKELLDLAKEQEELRKDIEDKKVDDRNAKDRQDELNKSFDSLQKQLKETEEMNQLLDRPMELNFMEDLQNAVKEQMQESSKKLEKGKKSAAGENQKSAEEKLRELSESLNEMQEQANQTQDAEDINSLKRVLKNLMTLSFDQESTMKGFQKIQDSDPRYRSLGRKQRNIIDDTKIVRDSLFALAKRQPKIAFFVDQELAEIRVNHELALENIDEHKKRELGANQQLVMTSYNNLALLLNEALESMQSQMQSEGKGQCENPGGKGRPKPGSGKGGEMDMKQMLKQQLEQMQKGMQPGGIKPPNQPGGVQPNGSGMGMPGLLNKEIAKMVGEQTMIRQRLEQLRNELNKDGKGKGNQLNPLIKELEEQERALLNKQFSPEMVRRQKEILTRLLESEKALMERDFDEKRESAEGKDKPGGNQIEYLEYNREKLRQIELLKPVDPTYRKYYKDKANAYFNGVQ